MKARIGKLWCGMDSIIWIDLDSFFSFDVGKWFIRVYVKYPYFCRYGGKGFSGFSDRKV